MKILTCSWQINIFIAVVGLLVASVNAQVVYEADFSDGVRFPIGGADPYVPLNLDGFSSEDISITNSGTVTDARSSNNSSDRGFAETVNRNAFAIVADGSSYSSTVDFTFQLNPTTSSNAPILQSTLFNGDATTDQRLAMTLTRNADTNDKYRLRLVTNWGNTYPSGLGFNQSATTSELGLGLSFNSGGTQDLVSDMLQLTTTLTAGSDLNSWTATGTLTNLDTSSTLLTYTRTNVLFDASIGSNVFGGFGTGQVGTNANTINREFSRFSFSTEAPDPPIDFGQLKNEVIARKSELDNLIAQADSAGINTDYSKVSTVVVDRFLTYSQFDYDNPEKVQNAVDSVWWTNRVPANYSTLLPLNELQDSLVVADRAIAELQSQIDGSITLQDPVNFKTGTMTQDAGYYKLNGRTAFPSSFSWMPEDAETLNTFGSIGDMFYNLSEVQQNLTVRPSSITSDKATLETYNAANAAPHVFFLGRSLASWMKTNHPEVEEGARHFTPFDIDNPLIRTWYTKLFEGNLPATVPVSGDTPRIHLLANEPHFATRSGGWLAENGVSDLSYDKYQAWLENRYNGINELNSAYGTTHASFADARNAMDSLMAANGGVPTNLQGGAQWYDWSRFNMDRVNEWFTFLADGVKAQDPGAQTSIKLLGGQLSDDWRDHGMDMEYLINLQDVLGSDYTTIPGNFTDINVPASELDWTGRYALDWAEQSMGLDFAKSLAPDKPFYDSEWHALSTNRWRDFEMDPDYVRSSLWLAYTHGVSATKAWVWSREDDGDFESVNSDFVGEILTQPEALDAYGRTFKELNAHSDSVADLASGDREFLIFYTEDSAIQDVTYTDRLQEVYEALKLLNVSVGFTTANNISTLDAGQTVIIPPTEFILDETLQSLQNFAGNIVLVEPSGSFAKTEHGVARGASGISAFGTVALDDVLTMADSFDALLDPLKTPSLIEVEFMDSDLQSAYGVLMKQTLDDATGEVTLSLINTSVDQRWASFVLPDGVDHLIDLITGQQLSGDLQLDPYDVFLLRTVLSSLAGDFDGDGDVDADDIDFYAGNIGQAALGELAELDLDDDGTITLSDHNLHVTQLVQTSNGETGTLLGDLNLDGRVDVLGDAFGLVGNLGSSGVGWAQGDFNADQNVNVLGDAFALVGNLGGDNATSSASSVAVPEPTGCSVVTLAFVGLLFRRHRNSIAASN